MPATSAEAPQRYSAMSIATVLISVVIATGALRWLRDILTPLALAFFLVVMIDGFVRALRTRLKGVSERAVGPIALVAAVLLFGGAVYILAESGSSFFGRLMSYQPQINGLIARFAGMFNVAVPPTVDELLQQLNPTRYLGPVAGALQGVVEHAIFVLIYVGFLMASRRGFERKVVRLFPEREDRRDAVEVFTRIRDGVESYLFIQTLTGIVIAVLAFVLMSVLGLDNAFFWAFLIFFLSYIPIIGGAVGIALPPLFALVQFPTFWQAGVLLVVMWFVHFFIGNVVLPKMQGDSMNIDPIVVLLSLGFWGALWGIPGMFMSTPLTVMVMVVLAQFDGTRWIAVLLSHTGDPLHTKEPPAPQHALEPKSGSPEEVASNA
jgi:AI-2 transport protein TqsA